MELFLDSVNLGEIEECLHLGIISGLTTTPTFMHRHGISDIDGAIIKLSKIVPSLHIEALGENYEEIIAEARRIRELPLEKNPVFKIPVSSHGIKACSTLVREGYEVNIHLVYNLNQSYMAMEAGATYVCPLVGRLHDQGYDAMDLIDQMVKVVNRYGYKSKVMVSSVRHPEHVRQALLLGAHACTVPWNVIRMLPDNNLTSLGTKQFIEHTKLMTVKVRDVIREKNPVCHLSDSVMKAIVEMTESKLGAISIVDDENKLVGIFTDGDIRRQLMDHGEDVIKMKMSDFQTNKPVTIHADSLLHEAVTIFSKHEYDNIIVEENNVPLGMIDIQDFAKMNLLG